MTADHRDPAVWAELATWAAEATARVSYQPSRQDGATAAQRRLLARFRLPTDVSKAEASRLIAELRTNGWRSTWT